MNPGDSLKNTKNGDYLANERTFLAYLRTALSFIAFGFVVARFSLFAQEFAIVTHQHVRSGVRISTIFGVIMAAGGVAVALFGARRYARTHDAINATEPAPMAPRAALAFAIALALIGAAVATALLTV